MEQIWIFAYLGLMQNCLCHLQSIKPKLYLIGQFIVLFSHIANWSSWLLTSDFVKHDATSSRQRHFRPPTRHLSCLSLTLACVSEHHVLNVYSWLLSKVFVIIRVLRYNFEDSSWRNAGTHHDCCQYVCACNAVRYHFSWLANSPTTCVCAEFQMPMSRASLSLARRLIPSGSYMPKI